jgi:hypothetical protein
MPLFGNGIDKATAEVRRLKGARSKLKDREQKAREEMERLRADLPALALADVLGDGPEGRELPGSGRFPGTTPSYNRLMALDLEVRTCTDALPALFPKLESAMRAVNVARAGEIRKRVAKLQSEFAEHKEQSDKLRVALENHESAFFQPAPMTMVGDFTAPMAVPTVTRSEKMRQEIAKLESEAVALEQKPVNVGGGVDASSLAELLQKTDECPDDTIPPTQSEVEAWFAEGLALANAEWNGTGRRRGDPEPMTAELYGFEKYRTLSVSLVWLKDGVIDREHSSVRYANRFEIPRELAMEHGAEYTRQLSE